MSIHDETEADNRAERMDTVGRFDVWSHSALEAFRVGLNDALHPDDLGGKTGRGFGTDLKGVAKDQLPASQLKRTEVFSLNADLSVNTATVCAAVMAWGGMNQRFSGEFFSMADDGWLAVADRIRSGGLGRAGAYEAFLSLRADGKLYGVGPAYFTKIIYFLTPRSEGTQHHAYIMDQWAGCSINLLAARELVKMDVTRMWHKDAAKPSFNYRVSDANTANDYVNFCVAADALRARLDLTPDEVDRLMIGNGGRTKSTWRKYVLENRSI